MKMSVVTKLWLNLVGVILVILLILGVILSQFYQDFYYNEQTTQLINSGKTLANVVSEKGDIAKEELDTVGKLMAAQVMIIDKSGLIRACGGGMMGLRQGTRLSTEEVSKVLSGETAVVTGFNKSLNQTVLSVAVPIKLNGKILGAIFLFKPLSSFEENISSIQQIVALAAFISILFATILAFLLSKTLSGPLVSMQKAALAMAEGNFNVKLYVGSNDEIGLLAFSLNNLSEKLKQTLDDLHEEKDKLAKTLTAMSDFVANVSHELRTPLSLMQGYAEAVIDFGEDASARNKYSQVILEETKRLSALVNDLLRLSKAEGDTVLKKEATNITKFLEQVIEEYLPICKENNIAIEMRSEKEIPYIKIDRAKIKQVMINLLDNACRYGVEGKKVVINVLKTEKSIKIAVKDFGNGIPPEDIPFLWDRFYRVDKSRRRDTGGTGLGLAIVKNIISAHAGKVYVESKLGEYTEFSFEIFTT